ncbi:MAG: transposase [Cyclobacteriaceae bacterium]
MEFARHHVQFFTAVCHGWLPLLASDESKLMLIRALRHRVERQQVKIGGYVIMPNHFHVIWRVSNDIVPSDFQRDLLKFTARELISHIRKTGGELALEPLYVGTKDRTFQVWKRNSMVVDLFTEKFINQKLEYIHDNPCQPHWLLAKHPVEYRFSSARFHESEVDEFGIMSHVDDL